MEIVLPYPDLDFVPLDPLSAEEMNQIVANYTFLSNQFPLNATNIADGAITNAKLATGAVKSNSIDWSNVKSFSRYDMNNYKTSIVESVMFGRIVKNNRTGLVTVSAYFDATLSGISNEYLFANLPETLAPMNADVPALSISGNQYDDSNGLGRCYLNKSATLPQAIGIRVNSSISARRTLSLSGSYFAEPSV